MHEHVTLLPPEARPDERGLSSTRKQVSHAVPEGTHRAVQPAGAEAG